MINLKHYLKVGIYIYKIQYNTLYIYIYIIQPNST